VLLEIYKEECVCWLITSLFYYLLLSVSALALCQYWLDLFLVPNARMPKNYRLTNVAFTPFDDAHMKFDVRFYLVAILFIIFDLEIAFLFPWAVVLNDIGVFGLLAMFLFLALLVVGFIYEWKKGALEWE